MKLIDLLASLPVYHMQCGSQDIEITSLTADSRKVETGSLFIALVGHNVDGHRFCSQAVEKGAVALLVEKGAELPQLSDVAIIEVSDTRRALAIVADAFYGQPSHRLNLIGVTGTNGKTTTTHLIRSILEDHGFKTGLIGTISTVIGDEIVESKNTTPESVDLQHTLARMVEVGCQYAVMEVSSHALDQGRVRGAQFASAIFTNLTQDHLDYHHTMEEYQRAKGLFFVQLGNTYGSKYRPAILNADDSASASYAKITAAPVITYGIDHEADVRATNLEISDSGIRFWLETWKGSLEVQLQLTGRFNVYNSLAAITASLIEGLPLTTIITSLAKIRGVDGRLERVDGGQNFTVFVDYAHTPDSLENALSTIRQFATGRVISIVGCGGNRDRSKRPKMARIAAELSDLAILTSDNPRREDPQAILDDMIAGLKSDERNFTNYEVVVDRKEAIERAVREAKASDIVLIAGKGHETYQDFGDHVIHFDDREVALEAIRGNAHA